MKYIMMVDEHGMHYPFIFGEAVTHLDMVKMARRVIPLSSSSPVSAGFYDPREGKVYSYSESMSSQYPDCCTSRPVDAAYIALGQAAAAAPEGLAMSLYSELLAKKAAVASNEG